MALVKVIFQPEVVKERAFRRKDRSVGRHSFEECWCASLRVAPRGNPRVQAVCLGLDSKGCQVSGGSPKFRVCNLVFLSRYMRPEGPWQRLRRCPRATAVVVYIYDLFPGTSTGLAGHSRAPSRPKFRLQVNPSSHRLEILKFILK